MLTAKGIDLTPIVIEFSLWGEMNMREFNEIDLLDGLNADKLVIIKTIQENYYDMVAEYR